MLAREADLEKQLEKAHSDLVAMKHEKNTLNMSIKELQDRLTRKETEGPAKSSLSNIGTVEEAMRRGEREKDLEKQVGYLFLNMRMTCYDCAVGKSEER